jgi:hypothetical protein
MAEVKEPKFIPGDVLLAIHEAHSKHGRDPTLLKAVGRIKILHKMTPLEVESWFKEETLRTEALIATNKQRLFLLRKQNTIRRPRSNSRVTNVGT